MLRVPLGRGMGEGAEPSDGRLRPGDCPIAPANLGLCDGQMPEEVGLVPTIPQAGRDRRGPAQMIGGGRVIAQGRIGLRQAVQGQLLSVAIADLAGMSQDRAEELARSCRLTERGCGEGQVARDIDLQAPVAQKPRLARARSRISTAPPASPLNRRARPTSAMAVTIRPASPALARWPGRASRASEERPTAACPMSTPTSSPAGLRGDAGCSRLPRRGRGSDRAPGSPGVRAIGTGSSESSSCAVAS